MRPFFPCLFVALLLPSAAAAQLPGLPRIDGRFAHDFHQALVLAGRVLATRAPRMTDAIDPRKLERRVNETLRPWVSDQLTTIAAVDAALAHATSYSPAHAAIADGLMAALWDAFADQLAAIRPPRTMRHDPRLAALWAQNLDDQVEPLRERARRAYALCAACDHPAVATWAAYCARHR